MVGVPLQDAHSDAHERPLWPRSPFRGVKGDEENLGSDDVSAADSWSIRSEYGSTLDGGDERGTDVLNVPEVVRSEDERSGESDGAESEEDESSVLGLRSHWDSTYAEELATFDEHGEPGEIWFGADVMEKMSEWTAKLAAAIASGDYRGPGDWGSSITSSVGHLGDAATWRVLDVGCGNGLLLHALVKQGFKDLTGTDYSEAAVQLAKSVAARDAPGANLHFLVDDVLQTRVEGPFELVVDKGTLDAVGLHPEGRLHRQVYRETLERVVAAGGLLVITSCNNTKDELVTEFTQPGRSRGDETSEHRNGGAETGAKNGPKLGNGIHAGELPVFEYLDHIRTYPVLRFGGSEGTRVCTVAFRRRSD